MKAFEVWLEKQTFNDMQKDAAQWGWEACANHVAQFLAQAQEEISLMELLDEISTLDFMDVEVE